MAILYRSGGGYFFFLIQIVCHSLFSRTPSHTTQVQMRPKEQPEQAGGLDKGFKGQQAQVCE